MKRTFFTLMLSFIIFSLGACNKNNSNLDNTISESKLTEREKEILSSTTDKSFVFDFNVDNSYKKLSVWVEKYESGKLVEDKKNHITTEIKDKGTIIFTTMTITNQSMFQIGINSDGSTSKSSNLETITEDVLEGIQSTWGRNEVENNPITEKMVLASISYSKGKGGMNSLSTDFYNDVEGHINEIKDYDVVYLLRSEFTK